MTLLAEILEIFMVVSFGVSWPINANKAWRARTAKGSSITFLLLVIFGYICGIAAKFMIYANPNAANPKWYVVMFYIINLVVVSVNVGIYFRNKRLDAAREKGEVK